jgi:hypothetical protein
LEPIKLLLIESKVDLIKSVFSILHSNWSRCTKEKREEQKDCSQNLTDLEEHECKWAEESEEQKSGEGLAAIQSFEILGVVISLV